MNSCTWYRERTRGEVERREAREGNGEWKSRERGDLVLDVVGYSGEVLGGRRGPPWRVLRRRRKRWPWQQGRPPVAPVPGKREREFEKERERPKETTKR